MHVFADKQNPPQQGAKPGQTRTVGPLVRLQRRIGDQPGSPISAPTRFAHDFGRLPIHPGVREGGVRGSRPGDAYELEADRAAERVVRTPEASPLRTRGIPESGVSDATAVPILPGDRLSSGQPLGLGTRRFMESRFGFDFSQVRTHTDREAAHACRVLNAQAFTDREHIYFGAGKSPGTDELTAHELTHVVQQAGGQRTQAAPQLQRKLELRPPGRGERSAFGRAQELVDRLNTISPAIQYELKGQELVYTVKDAAALTHFDTVMKGFIDRAELVPMRLITREGYVGGGPVAADDFSSAYVDLEDLLADDIYAFQSDLVHFLTERFQVKNYARRIGTNLDPLFSKAHRAGKDAEAALLQSLFRDPSIRFVYEETKPNDTWVNAFKSKDHEYWVFQVMRKSERELAGGEMWVQKKDRTKVTMDDFRKERAAAVP